MRFFTGIKISASILTLLFINACQSEATMRSAGEGFLNVNWKLVSIIKTPVDYPLDQNFITITLTSNSLNKFNGFAGCNNYFGLFEWNGSEISFGKIAATLIMCPFAETEQRYLLLIDKVDSFALTENELIFFKGSDELLRFSR